MLCMLDCPIYQRLTKAGEASDALLHPKDTDPELVDIFESSD